MGLVASPTFPKTGETWGTLDLSHRMLRQLPRATNSHSEHETVTPSEGYQPESRGRAVKLLDGTILILRR